MNTDHENFENHDSLLLENLSRQHLHHVIIVISIQRNTYDNYDMM